MQLDVRDIHIARGPQKKAILNGVSFTTPDGCFMSLLGPSVAGKSTLLSILSGALVQDAGSIEINGESIDALPPHKRNLGFVYQDVRLFPNMSVGENVAFGLKMRGVGKAERKAAALRMLERVQLAGMYDREVSSLSGGQAQRVALARALVLKPQVLLLDEPFSGLDELLRDDMRSLVLGLHREMGITTIMVTHDAIEALELSDHIVYLEGGRVLQQGTPRELFEMPASPEVASSFGDSSTLHGNVHDGGFSCADLHIPAQHLARFDVACSGEATAVIRYAACSLDAPRDSDDIFLGSLPVRCGVFRGQEWLVRCELCGQVLTVPATALRESGETVDVWASPSGVFVYS